nr:hypothetical protein DCAR_022673 [Ipomoea batatas]
MSLYLRLSSVLSHRDLVLFRQDFLIPQRIPLIMWSFYRISLIAFLTFADFSTRAVARILCRLQILFCSCIWKRLISKSFLWLKLNLLG